MLSQLFFPLESTPVSMNLALFVCFCFQAKVYCIKKYGHRCAFYRNYPKLRATKLDLLIYAKQWQQLHAACFDLVRREARIERGSVGFSTLRVKRGHMLATPQNSQWLLLIFFFPFFTFANCVEEKVLQLLGIARAVVEDMKISRAKPLLGSLVQRDPSLPRTGRRLSFFPEAHEGSPAQGEGLEEQSCPTAAGEEDSYGFSVPEQETGSHLIAVI